MLWAIYCVDKADTAALRDRHMRPHREYLDQRNAILVLAGATLADGAAASGSLFVINVRTRSEAEAFSTGDPFTQAGIFAQITITRMRKSQWNPRAAEGA
jgi:uncharacterized protein YciI